MRGVAWSDEQTAELRDLWCVQGQPIKVIQKLTGHTDWAIRGKIRYEGWPPPVGLQKRAFQRQSAARLNTVRQVGPAHLLPANKKLLRGSVWRALANNEPVSMVDLEPGMCKWPIGEESPYLFCGASAVGGPYCQSHAAISRSAS